MAQTKFSKIAMKLAIEAKSIGMTHDLVSVCADNEFHVHGRYDMNGLVEEAFDALLDEVDAALPSAAVDHRISAIWAQAGMDNRAQQRMENRGWE